MLTETWLNASILDSELLPLFNDFDIFRCDRKNKRGGGVLIAAHHSLQCCAVDIPCSLEAIFIRCKAAVPPVTIGVCYRPPDSDPAFVGELHDALQLLTSDSDNAPLLLFGDFNFPAITWSDLALTMSKQNTESDFIDTCLTFNLSQMISFPTRTTLNSSSLLDLFLTTQPDKVSSVSSPNRLSDHAVIHATFQCNLPNPKKVKKTITLYDKADYQGMNDELASFCDSFLVDFSNRSVDENWELFKNKMQQLVNMYIPTITITERPTSPWYNNTLKRLSNKKKRQFRSAKKSKSNHAWKKYRETEKLYASMISDAKRTFFSSTLPDMLRTNPKKFWSTINPTHAKPISLLDQLNIPIPEFKVAETLNSTFCSVFTDEPDDVFPCVPDVFPSVPSHDYPAMPSVIFEPNGIIQVIDSLKVTSSAGIDCINSKVLKNTKHLSAAILSHIFQQSLSSGVVPRDWKVGKVIPIPKKGPSSSPSNYRPISLTCVCCKIMEHIIYSQTVKFLVSVNFFHPSQHGFQKGLSCDTQLALFINDISSSIDHNIPVDALFLDFEKAFDKVPHKRLFLKLSRLNIDPAVLEWIKNFLSNREQFVYSNQISSTRRPVLSGVPQGTVLGPLLFLIYVNDLPTNISSQIRLFADDCVIYRPINCPNDSQILQNDLITIETWCKNWLMTLNIRKTSVVSFHRRKFHPVPSYFFSGSEISPVNSYKYLGINITPDLNWSSHITNISNEANKVLGYLRRNLRLAPPSVKLLAYQTLVRPKLEYACAVWDPHQCNLSKTLESVQNRASRFIYSDYSRHSSVTNLKIKAHLPNLELRRKAARLVLFHKFFHSLSDTSAIMPAHRISSRTNHQNPVYPAHARTTAHLRSFFVHTAKDWNDLPPHVVHHSNPILFKTHIEKTLYNMPV